MVAEQVAATAQAAPLARRPNWRDILAPDMWSALAHASLVLAALFFLLAVPHFVRDGTEEFVADVLQHGYVFVWLMAVTVLGRTLPLRMLAAFFFLGMFLSVGVVLFLGGLLEEVVGSGRMFDSFTVPLLEEGAKAVPIALLYWFLIRRGWQPSISDGLLLGFVLGAGMAIHEDALYQRVYGEGTDESLLGMFFPAIGRESTLSRIEVFGFFHSGWGSLLGLAIGASFVLMRRFRWAALIGIIAFIIVVLDHAIGNLIIENMGVGDLGALWTLDLEGMLPIYLLVIGIPVAVISEVLIVRRMAAADPALPGLSAARVLPWLGQGLTGILRVQAARNYTRARRAFHYLLWAGPPTDGAAVRAQLARVATHGRDAGVDIYVSSGRPGA